MPEDIRLMNVDVPGPAGLLEGVINASITSEPRAIALLAHPLPTAGGTMHTKAAFHAARALVLLHGVGVPSTNQRGGGTGRIGWKMGGHKRRQRQSDGGHV